MKKNNVLFFNEEKSIFQNSSVLIKKIEKEILPERGYKYEISKNWNDIIKSKFINESQQELLLKYTYPSCLKRYSKALSYGLYIKCKHSEVKSVILANEDRIISNINSMFNMVVVSKIKIV